ncbi:MAG: hypothetical protein DMG39_23535 [Acidobacteria bacterium]|nr:MAG: hypothetical protein DMG39_23535 [Acidobacteriota bacterium]
MVFCNPKRRKGSLAAALFAAVGTIVAACLPAALRGQTGGAQAANAARAVGTIKSVSGNKIVLTTDAGGDVSVVVQQAAKLVRVEPGQKDLKEAVPIPLEELLPGDRILVRGQPAEDGKTVLATAVIAMKKSSIAEKQAHEREEWQKHGMAGLVSSVDPAASTMLITLPGMGEKKTVTVHLSQETILRRYAPDSIKFDDAKPARLEQIKVGDQLRARGTRSADGSELTATEIVCGTFRNIAGTISSIDASANSITVQDLATKKPITVRITSDSQVRKLPLPMAQGIAARLKRTGADSETGSAAGGNPSATQGTRAAGTQVGGAAAGGPGGPGRGAGGGDFQQALNRMPPATLGDLQKGDAVMIVATEGGPNGMPSVITLLGGVEPILQASSNASTILSPWSLSEAPGGEAGNP